MKPIIASTGPQATALAAMAAISNGGNAVDAVVAGALAWPPSLLSAGLVMVSGSGLGHGSAVFPARVPGFGLSKPRRLKLIGGKPASQVATPCTAQGLLAIMTRWGTTSFGAVVRAALKVCKSSDSSSHGDALELLVNEGVGAFSKGKFSVEAARKCGPLEGGLLTRRDLIETGPTFEKALKTDEGLWIPEPIAQLRKRPNEIAREKLSEQSRMFSLIALDHRGALACISLDQGQCDDPFLPSIFGVVPNTLLFGQSVAKSRKVGQQIPLSCGVAAGGDGELTALAGFVPSLIGYLERHQDADFDPAKFKGLLCLRRRVIGKIEIEGAQSIEGR